MPVRDLAEARAFYADTLGCRIGRTRAGADHATRSSRHFGVTLARDEFEDLVARFTERGVQWIAPVSTDDAGSPTEQTKAKLVDPSGNVIEFKTYPHVEAALEVSADPPPGTGASRN